MPPTWLNVIVPLLSAVVGAVVGGLVVHRFAVTRDARNEQRARRIEHLISAYQRLIAAANQPEGLSADHQRGLESAVSDIMLLGQKAEVDAAREFLVAFARDGNADLDELLAELRSSLRDELNLDKTPMPKPYNLRMR
ncbi:Putative uncharacterized protein [Propionibacterium freudenreichii subsp. freudenreichii]|uniref:Uncharacterized protein n=1 Tax=Propionibacterium freudenreichii subsp. freudenreichii TaxID=66712 RepID=A0A0B7NZG6_PROFF|nr:hypothetical protein [Propionibacterium freudenreichii]CEP26437.1 Putative uncharacterized protein [Propionibacterium freudenreichii subsp. freudenreichii]MCT3016554.1 hypothetical protein [Propionibacterium freudenreichii]MDK9646451.1 hypothetical protein [Propionibacterium freudenreichii]MDK9656076.1 hypothetical protein [Propionibacterium freudenreichii]MDK9666961.1 hypothetical protein [Propionibacterium freudenreichii]